jgi:hypothetical protein
MVALGPEGGGGGGRGGGDGIFGVSCRCGDASFSIFSGLGVGGNGIFVYLPDMGIECVGIEEEEEEEEEEGNHLRKEPVPYYMNYKKFVQ